MSRFFHYAIYLIRENRVIIFWYKLIFVTNGHYDRWIQFGFSKEIK